MQTKLPENILILLLFSLCMKVDFHSILIWELFSGLTFLKIKTTRQRRTCLSLRHCGSVSISRKCLQQLVWAIFVDGPTPFSSLSKVFGSGLTEILLCCL